MLSVLFVLLPALIIAYYLEKIHLQLQELNRSILHIVTKIDINNLKR